MESEGEPPRADLPFPWLPNHSWDLDVLLPFLRRLVDVWCEKRLPAGSLDLATAYDELRCLDRAQMFLLFVFRMRSSVDCLWERSSFDSSCSSYQSSQHSEGMPDKDDSMEDGFSDQVRDIWEPLFVAAAPERGREDAGTPDQDSQASEGTMDKSTDGFLDKTEDDQVPEPERSQALSCKEDGSGDSSSEQAPKH